MMQKLFRRAAPAMVLLVLILLHPDVGTERILSPQQSPTSGSTDTLRRALDDNRRAGRFMQALYDVETLAALSGWTPEWQRQAGDLWRDMGDLTRAVPCWEAAAGENSTDAGLLRDLAQAYVDLGRWADASEALKELAALSPQDGWANYQLGLILAAYDPRSAAAYLQIAAQSKSYSDISNALIAVLQTDPADPLIGIRVGAALEDRELWAYAELAFEQAAAVQQPFPEAAASIGLARDRQGKDGSQWIQQAVALAPDNPQVLYLQGLHLRAMKDYDQSLAVLLQAVRLAPDNPAISAEVGSAYRLLGDLSQAEHWLQAAVQLSGDDPKFRTLLALFYADEAGNLTPAGLDTLRRTSVLLPNDPDVRAGFGWALYSMGQTEQGLAEIEIALKIAPDNPRALFYKAKILIAQNQKEAALPLLKRVVELKSYFAADAQQILDELAR
jgi:tetratricopeptide (TPR) repeat protein